MNIKELRTFWLENCPKIDGQPLESFEEFLEKKVMKESITDIFRGPIKCPVCGENMKPTIDYPPVWFCENKEKHEQNVTVFYG